MCDADNMATPVEDGTQDLLFLWIDSVSAVPKDVLSYLVVTSGHYTLRTVVYQLSRKNATELGLVFQLPWTADCQWLDISWTRPQKRRQLFLKNSLPARATAEPVNLPLRRAGGRLTKAFVTVSVQFSRHVPPEFAGARLHCGLPLGQWPAKIGGLQKNAAVVEEEEGEAVVDCLDKYTVLGAAPRADVPVNVSEKLVAERPASGRVGISIVVSKPLSSLSGHVEISSESGSQTTHAVPVRCVSSPAEQLLILPVEALSTMSSFESSLVREQSTTIATLELAPSSVGTLLSQTQISLADFSLMPMPSIPEGFEAVLRIQFLSPSFAPPPVALRQDKGPLSLQAIPRRLKTEEPEDEDIFTPRVTEGLESSVLGHGLFIADLLSSKIKESFLEESSVAQFESLSVDFLSITQVDPEQSETWANLRFIVNCGFEESALPLVKDLSFSSNSASLEGQVELPYFGHRYACIQVFHRPSASDPDVPVGVVLIDLERTASLAEGVRKLYKIRRFYPSSAICGYLKVKTQFATPEDSGTPGPLVQIPRAISRRKTLRRPYVELTFDGILTRNHPDHPSYAKDEDEERRTLRAPPHEEYVHGELCFMRKEHAVKLRWLDNESSTPLTGTVIKVPGDEERATLVISDSSSPLLQRGHHSNVIKATIGFPLTWPTASVFVTVVPLIESSPSGRKIRTVPFFVKCRQRRVTPA